MVWVIVVVAIAVLGLAAWAGTGRLGEMPEVVNDRPKGHIPDGPITPEFVDAIRLPRASTGYARSQVDTFFRQVAAGSPLLPTDAEFDVVRGGYDMQVVDDLLDRVALPPEDAADYARPDNTRPTHDVDEDADDRPAATTRDDVPVAAVGADALDDADAGQPAPASTADTLDDAATADERSAHAAPLGSRDDDFRHVADEVEGENVPEEPYDDQVLADEELAYAESPDTMTDEPLDDDPNRAAADADERLDAPPRES